MRDAGNPLFFRFPVFGRSLSQAAQAAFFTPKDYQPLKEKIEASCLRWNTAGDCCRARNRKCDSRKFSCSAYMDRHRDLDCRCNPVGVPRQLDEPCIRHWFHTHRRVKHLRCFPLQQRHEFSAPACLSGGNGGFCRAWGKMCSDNASRIQASGPRSYCLCVPRQQRHVCAYRQSRQSPVLRAYDELA